jgi:hypothetical protein
MPEKEERKYFWTEFKVMVLSEQPLKTTNLEDLPTLVNDGPCVLHTFSSQSHQVKPRTIAKMLNNAGSDPAFFGLSATGAFSNN